MMYNLFPKNCFCALCAQSVACLERLQKIELVLVWMTILNNWLRFKNLLARCSTILGPESGRQPFQMFLCLQVWSDISFQVQSKEKAFESKTGDNFLMILIRIYCLLSKIDAWYQLEPAKNERISFLSRLWTFQKILFAPYLSSVECHW